MNKDMVSRSAFQKVVEENKKLLADLRILTYASNENEFTSVCEKWTRKFQRDQELKDMINEWGRDYIKNHPDDEAVKFIKRFKDGTCNPPSVITGTPD